MAAPELRLSVGLDLALLRQQISTIGTQLGGQPITLRTQFDRRLIVTQYKALDRFLNSKTFTLKIKDVQLDASIAKAEKLKDRLEALQDTKLEIPVSGRAAVSQREARKIRADVYRGIMAQGGKILLPVGLQPLSDSAASKFKADVVRKLGSATIDVKANLQSAAIRGGAKTQAEIDAEVARGMQTISAMGAARMAGGGVTEAARRSQLQSRLETGGFTNEQLRQIAKQMNVSGVSKLNKGNIIQKIVADASVEMIKKFLDPQAVMRNPDRSGVQRVLDTFARGVFHMLGMDPAQVAAQRRARLAPPAINWPAQVPPSSRPPIGPSSTGRALPPGANFAALPGTSFAEQKRLVGDILSPSLKEALRGAANAFVDSIRAELNAAVRSVNVRDLGTSMQAALGGRQIAGLLPSATGMSVQDRIAQAYQRSAARGLSVMAEGVGGGGPPQLPPGVGRTPAPYGGGRGGFPSDGMMGPSATKGYEALSRLSGALNSTDRFFRQTRLPLAGAVEELAGEFGQATKQVLLYGAAYKGLAFIMDLPRQTLQAATTLQTLRNQLQAVTGSTEEAGRSFQFLGSLANQFSVPLDSVRQGFVRMYASMQPAGFGAEEIEGLFTGITKAAATFGMSADKVDRVTYALSQMASKGQITAEELRGQLGDVLPGSLALFAEAAQMTIPEFSKAMEDGAFRGKAMQQVLNNVAILLNSKFSAGAKGASQTLQGALNAMQNSLLRLYEAFEPLVNTVARTVFPVIADAVGEATKAVQAFAAAAAGNESPGNMLDGLARRIFTAFKQISEIGQSLARIIASLGPTFEILGRSLLLAVEQAARFVNTPIGTALAGFAAKAGVALIAVQLLTRTGIAALVSQLIILIRNVRLAGGGLTAFAAAAGRSAVAARLLRTAITGLFLGGVLLGIEALVTHIGKVANRLSDARKEALSAAQAIRSMGATELVTEKRTRQANVALLEKVQRPGGDLVSQEDAERLKNLGLQVKLEGNLRTGIKRRVTDLSLVEGYLQREKQLLGEVEYAYKGLDEAAAPPALTPIDLQPSGDPDKAARKAEDDAAKQAERDRLNAERLANQQQQLITKTAEHQVALRELAFTAEQNLTGQRFEEVKRIIDYEYDYRLARANEIQAIEISLEKKLAQARLNSLNAVFERSTAIREAQLKVENAKALRSAARQAATVPVPAAQAGTIPGAPSAPVLPSSTGLSPHERALLDTIAFAEGTYNRPNSGYQTMFTGRQFSDLSRHPRVINSGGGHRSDAAGRYQFLSTTWDSLGLRAFSPANQDIGALQLARRRGVNPAAPLTRSGIDKLAPEWASFPTLRTGTSYYGQGGKSFGEIERFYNQKLAGYSAGMPMSGPSFSMEKREQDIEFSVEQAEEERKVKTAMADLELMNRLLEEGRNVSLAIGEAIGQTLPVEQLKLDNQVLTERNRLILEGAPAEAIEAAEKLTRARASYSAIETAINNQIREATVEIASYDDQLAKGAISSDDHARATKALNDLLTIQRNRLQELPDALREVEAETLKTTLTQLRQADALKAIEEAVSMVNDAVDGVVSSYKDLFVDIMSGGDIKEAAKRMQESLSKQVFTMFIDFSMKPVEKFFKDQLLNIFGLPNEEEQRAETIAAMERQIAALDRNTAALQGTPAGASGQTFGGNASLPSPLMGNVLNAPAFEMSGKAMQEASEQAWQFPDSLGGMGQAMEQFNANTSAVTSSLVDEARKGATATTTWQENLGRTVSAVGIAASSIVGITAGISQIKEGGVSGVLGGIGSIAMSLGSALGGFSAMGLFGGGGSGGVSVPKLGMFTAANGAVWKGGFQAFANGGVVNGPTLGLVGEGRYNEAIVPLPDGRSIPVKMNDQSASLREAMNTMSPMQAMAPILSMKFESTNIGGVEYVSRDQLEAAMASTRRQAAKDGALRGMNMTLDKIQQSPATRSRIGMRGR
jgi:tape measure domain-containing protein